MKNTLVQQSEKTTHTMIRLFLIMLTISCLPGMKTKVLGADLNADKLFQPDHLLDIQIKMAPTDWEKLRSQSDRSNSGMAAMFGGAMPTDRFTQFKADISIDGKTINQVGIRTKGFIGSLNSERPSFKVKFDEYVDQSPIDGLDRLTLNNNVQDGSLASQFLTYKLFNKAGIPAPRVSFAKVTVNDEYLGVYSHVESIRSPFLKNHYGDDSGEFYEGTLADFYPKALDRVEAKNKRTRKDKSQAIKLAQLLETPENFNLSEAEKLVNIDQFIRFWAMENLTGWWDGYSNNQNNYFAYSNPEDGNRFHFMPWGTDSALEDLAGPFGRMRGGEGGNKVVYGEGMLNNYLYHTKGIPARYKLVMEDLLENVWNESEIIKDLNRIQELTRDHLHEKQNRVDNSVEDVIEFVENRRDDIESEFKDWPVEMGEARLPIHTVELGTLKGQFSTVWKNERAESPQGSGEISVALELEGKKVNMTHMGIIAQPEAQRRFGGRGRRGGPAPEPRSALTFQGVRESDGHLVNITFLVANDAFTKSSEAGTTFQGMLTVIDPANNGRGFPFGGMPKSLTGKLKLNEASNKDNAPVSGTFDMTVQETRGGMFSRFRNGGGRGGPPLQRGGGPNRGRPPGR